MNSRIALGLATAALALSACEQASGNEEVPAALVALQDRAAIEDLLLEYYSHLGSGSHDGLDRFFTEDAVLDVNGIVRKGHAAIQSLYQQSGAPAPAPASELKVHVDYMHLTNPLIRVNGNTATATMFWTGVVSDDVNAPPEFQEMGREYDLLVKRDGKWLIQKRVIVADAGMPASMNGTYQRRKGYDITKTE